MAWSERTIETIKRHKTMKLSSYSLTDIGKLRKLNQDYVFTSEVPVGTLPDLFIVADGMGGHKAGEYASKCAVETIVSQINSSPERGCIRVISNAIREANRRVRAKAMSDDNYFGMGTTLVVASIDEDGLCVANVGDSRLYLISNGEIRQVTVDHSLVEEMVRMGGIDRETARTHLDKNIITRAISLTLLLRIVICLRTYTYQSPNKCRYSVNNRSNHFGCFIGNPDHGKNYRTKYANCRKGNKTNPFQYIINTIRKFHSYPSFTC